MTLAHDSDPQASAALRQRFERSPYACRTYVAMQRHGNFVPCVTDVNARKFFSFLVRYPATCRSRPRRELGFLISLTTFRHAFSSSACWPQGQLRDALLGRHGHFGVSGRVCVPNALVVLRSGDCAADQTPSRLMATGDSAVRVLQRGVVRSACAQQEHGDSDYSGFHSESLQPVSCYRPESYQLEPRSRRDIVPQPGSTSCWPVCTYGTARSRFFCAPEISDANPNQLASAVPCCAAAGGCHA
jgi:hypothetical protein